MMDRSNIVPRMNGIHPCLDKFGQPYKYGKLPSCFAYTCPGARVEHGEKSNALMQKASA
jgi:hypothetical protein